MAIKKSNLIKSKSEFVRSYDVTKGFIYTENMYVDRQSDIPTLESIPGFRRLYDFGEKINGIFLQDVKEGEKNLIIHSGKNIYRFEINTRDALSDLAPIAALSGNRSHSFEFGDDIYFMDGEGILKIGRDGTALWMRDGGELSPYIPTTYIDGKACEERNYLTDRFIQRFKIHNTEEYRIYSDGLTYSITDIDKKLCAVTGITSQNVYYDLHIPPTAVIDGITYRVTEIADRAFENSKFVTAVYTANNLEYIGKHAFDGCTSLETVVLSDTVRSLGYRAFYGATIMSDFYLGLGFEEFAEESISLTPHFQSVFFAGDEAASAQIKGLDLIEDPTVIFNRRNDSAMMGFPIKGDVHNIDSAVLGSTKLPSMLDGDKKMLTILFDDKYELIGKEVVVNGRLNPVKLRSIIPSDTDGVLTQNDIIQKCTLGTAHDGRIFLSGNPSLPGAVFYSSKDNEGNYRPLYFAESDFFVDGVSNYPITSLLSAHGTLTVFRSDDDGSGSIFCHTADTDSDGRRRYPLTYTHGGVSVPGGSYTLYDDAMFLSSRGVCALEKVAGSNYRALRTRSSTINSRLLSENLSLVKLTEWQDYLVMSCGGKIFLGDSAARYEGEFSFEYRWYCLNGIGTYKNAQRVYRYSETSPSGFKIKAESIGMAAEETVMSVSADGELIYYVETGGERYSVYPTDEMRGGDFSPAVSILGVGDLLFFGTESGSLCLFNNDKRGTPPPYVTNDPNFDETAYAESFGSIIHPYYYTFDDHAVNYVAMTDRDSCDIPYLEKRTLPHSMILNVKTYPRSNIYAEVRTDSGKAKFLGKYSAERLFFADTDFDSFIFSPEPYRRIRINEREVGWVEKQLSLSCNEFRTPIGITSLIYRFTVKGNPKYS